MMGDYKFIVRRTAEIVAVRYTGRGCRDRNRTTLWTLGRSRKGHRCRVLGEAIQAGDQCWLPLTHAVYRGHRISERGMLALERTHLRTRRRTS
jgi:hypothetical protein